MDLSLSTLGAFTAWLLRNSWQASVLIALVLLAQWAFRKQLAPRWRYALWLLVLIRLAVPVAPESPLSVFNLAPTTWARTSSSTSRAFEIQTLASDGSVSESPLSSDESGTNAHGKPATVVSPITNAEVGRAVLSPPPDGAMRTSHPTNFSAIDVALILSIVWLGGALSLTAFTLWFPLRLNRQLANQHSLVNPAVREVLADCQRMMNVRRVLPVVQSRAVNGPALMGFIRPWLLLPEGMLEKFTPEELRFVFLHELAHLKRRDIAVNWLMTCLLILHWFNPLVWFAFARMRADRELACDALALSYANEREAKPYGQTILKLLDGFTRPAAVAGLVGILENPQQLKRRIAMITQFKKSSGWPVAAVALIALLGCVSLTDSKRDQSARSSVSKKEGNVSASASASFPSGQTIMQKYPLEKFGEKVAKWLTDPWARPSPDGRYLAFINWSFGNLAIHDTQTGENRDLTTEGTWDPPDQFCDSMVWSTDGKQIAYFWWIGEGGDLRIVNRNGGKPRIVVPYVKDEVFEANAWSRDGRYILGPARKTVGTNKVFRITRVDVATGDVKVLKELPEAKTWFRVTLSPDNLHIAYNSLSGQLRAIDIDGSNDRVLLDTADPSDPVWMPDGRNLVFRSNRSGTEALWALPVKQGQAAGTPILVREGFFHSTLWGCSSDGTLYWLTRTPRANIFVADVDFAAGTIQTPRQVSLRFDGRSRHPRWSADGSTLSYVSRQFPGTIDATHVIHEVASGKERDVKIPAVAYWRGGLPQWSADFRKLYAHAKLDGQNFQGIYSFDAQTGTPMLISQGDVGNPNLSPDGNHLIYFRLTSSGTNRLREIVERDLRSGQERVIRRSDKVPVGPNPLLSCDGSRLAYLESDGTNGPSLQIISRADGATKTGWENLPGRRTRAAVLDWLPDNRRVLISVEDDEGQQLHLVDTETKSHRPFASLQPEDNRIFQLSVHPDGKRIAFWREGNINEIWTMKNILPQEKLTAK